MEKKHRANGSRFFFGFILLLIGLIMILYRSEILTYDVYDFLMSGKMLLVAIGGFVFFNGNRGAGIIVMGVGVFFMLPDIFEDYEQIKQFFWPSLLLLVGATLIFGSKRSLGSKKWNHHAHNRKYSGTGGGGTQTEYSAGSEGTQEATFRNESAQVDNDFFDEFVVFGGREINVVSSSLKGGRSTAIFGGAEVDLRKCEIAHDGCTVEVTTMFGGNVIMVPNDWTVLNKVTTIFGGYSDLRVKDPSYTPNPAKTIVLSGVCIFGGTEVRNYDKAH